MGFAVWAPRPSHVELELDERRRVDMVRDGRGWWRADVAHDGPYRFVVDGEPLPDPRSPWQPDGVTGPSHTVDHGAFAWTDGAWTGRPLDGEVVYELHVGTFTTAGTFDAAIDRLGHLVDLGVTALELMPVNEFPGRRGWGYDGVLLYAPHHAYGGPDGMKRLVDACHGAGLAVILDVVYNHLGPSHNHLARFGPYFTDRYRTPWGDAVNLDGAGSDEVRDFIVGNALGWVLDHHVDGLRLDAVHAFNDGSAVHLLEELASAVHRAGREVGRTVWVIAESDLNDPRLVRPSEVGGYGLDATWSDDFHHAIHAVVTGERAGYYADFGSVAQLARSLDRVYVHDGQWTPGRDRRHGRPVGDLPRHRFFGYAQDHDQVGNRADGQRLGEQTSHRVAALAAGLVLTSPFLPLVFQGEEWGATTPFPYFCHHDDPDLVEAIRVGRQREFAAFGWAPEHIPDPQAESTFRSAVLRWSELEHPDHRAVLGWYRTLLRLRRDWPDLRDDRPDATSVVFQEEPDPWLVVRRGSLQVVANLAPRTIYLPLPAGTRGDLLASSDGATSLVDDRVVLGPESLAVLR